MKKLAMLLLTGIGLVAFARRSGGRRKQQNKPTPAPLTLPATQPLHQDQASPQPTSTPSPTATRSIDPGIVVHSPFNGDPGMVVRSTFNGDPGIVAGPAINKGSPTLQPKPSAKSPTEEPTRTEPYHEV